MYGVPVRQLAATANAHSCRFDLLAREPRRPRRRSSTHLRSGPELGRAAADGRARTAARAGGCTRRRARRGCPVGTWESLQSPYVPLPATRGGASRRRCSPSSRPTAARRRKKLEERGRVDLRAGGRRPGAGGQAGGGLRARAERLEGRAGHGHGAGRAHARLLHGAGAGRGVRGAAVALLPARWTGGRWPSTTASTYGGRYLLLKPGYDESLKECSPGQLLDGGGAATTASRGACASSTSWGRTWCGSATGRTRSGRHTWLYVFNDSAFGRALCAAKFRWVPAAKEVVARWKQ